MTDIVTILSTMVYVRQIFEQTALLLQAADRIVEPRGFRKTGTRNIADTAATLADPKKWIPSEAHRFYLSDASPRVLLYVSVLFDDRYGEYESMPDCLVTAGAFVHRKERWGNEWEYGWSRWHGYHATQHDGTVQESLASDWPDRDDYVFEQVLTVGLPLRSVMTVDHLESLLGPLLAALPAAISPA